MGGGNQLEVVFQKPAISRKDVALRLQSFFGEKGDKVPVELLSDENGQVWSKGSANQWWVEKGGDARLTVFRMNFPGRTGYRRSGKVSIQFQNNVKEIAVLGAKQNLLDFGVQWVVAFGPIARATTKGSSAIGTQDIQQMIQQR